MTDVTFVSTPDDGSCGIGSYTSDLVKSFDCSVQTNLIELRTDSINPLTFLATAIKSGLAETNVIHVQHEYELFGPRSVFAWLFFPVLAVLSCIRRLPLVVTVHEVWTPEMAQEPPIRPKQWYIRAVNELLIRSADHIIFLSPESEEKFRENLPVSQYSVLEHGVNRSGTMSIDEDDAKAEFGYEPDDVVIVEPGYVSEGKGSHVFINLAKRMADCEFLLAGGSRRERDNSYLRELRDQAPQNVQFTGILDDSRFHAAFVASDIVVLPYLKVTQSGIFNWCIAYDVPVAASRQEYFSTIQHNWGCIRLFDVEDLEGMERTVRELLNDDSIRRRVREAGQTYRINNGLKSIAQKHRSIYRELTKDA